MTCMHCKKVSDEYVQINLKEMKGRKVIESGQWVLCPKCGSLPVRYLSKYSKD